MAQSDVALEVGYRSKIQKKLWNVDGKVERVETGLRDVSTRVERLESGLHDVLQIVRSLSDRGS